MKRNFFGALRQPVGNILLFLFKFDLVITIMFYAYVLCAIPILLLPIIGIAEVLWPVALGGGMLGGIILAWRNASNRGGILLALMPLAYGWWVINVFFIQGHFYEQVPLEGLFAWFFIILTLIVGILGALVIFEKSIMKFKARVGRTRAWAGIKEVVKNQRGIAGMCLVLITICGAYAGISNQSFPRGEILVVPQDYHVNFAFWANTWNDTYTAPQLAELNEHNVTLIGGWTNVSAIQFWRDNYPNVKFSFTVPGLYCDADAFTITESAKALINDVKNNNLNNCIGITLDWEGWKPSNATAHQQAIEIWSDFLDWKAINAPANFSVTLLSRAALYYDNLDGDMDLHRLWQAVDFQVPRFDEYTPTIYRCSYRGAKPFGDPVTYSSAWDVQDTYTFYKALDMNAKAIAGTFGNLSRMGVYLGETNCSCYGNDTQVYENGKYMGTGWDMLVQDSRICKAFGIKTITYFLLFATPTGDGWIMGGGFNAYGEDFLDRLDTAVNEPNATDSISISIGPISLSKTGLSSMTSPLVMDYVYNFDHPLEFAILMGIIIALGVLLFWREWRRQEKHTTEILEGKKLKDEREE